MNLEVIYIIGIGRSGTTLLNSLLGQHPEINTTPENYFASFFYRAYHQKTSFSLDDFHSIHQFNLNFHKLQPIVGYKYDFDPETIETINGSYKSFCNRIYSAYLHISNHSENAQFIVDKNPVNTLYADKILSFNPNAKFIFITRDYRANILSRIQSAHIHTTNPIYNGIRWNYFMKKAIKFQDGNPDRVIKLKYEDLAADPQNSMNQIFDFLQLDKQVISLDQNTEKRSIQESAPKITDDRFEKKYNDLSQPVSTKRVFAWKDKLSAKIINQLDFICGKYGEQLGYKPYKVSERKRSIETWIVAIPHRLVLWFRITKDLATYYLPIKLKIARFKKFIHKIERRRNARK